MSSSDQFLLAANSLCTLGALFWAFASLLRRPGDIRRQMRPAAAFLAPAWIFLAAAALASLLLAAPEGSVGKLALVFGLNTAVELAMAQLFLAAGSIWVYRSGIRGRGCGWLRRWRRVPELIPLKPFLAGALALNALTLNLLVYLNWFGPREGMRPDPAFEEQLNELMKSGVAFHLFVAARLFAAPFFEEAMYRHFLQTRLAIWLDPSGRRWFAACAAVSALWAAGHAGMLSLAWAKFAQIFLAGLLLGWLQRRWGVALCIAVHLAMNLGLYVYAS